MADTNIGTAILIASGSYSSSAGTITGTPFTWTTPPSRAALAVRMSMTPTSSGTATLDVYFQHSADYTLAGASSSNFAATWTDFAHPPQIAPGTSPASRGVLTNWVGTIAPSSSLNMYNPATATLTANTIIQGPTGGSWRAQAVVAGTSPVAASSSAWQFQVLVQAYK